jgi:hypothetical protein
MTQPKHRSKETKQSLQSRLRELGFKLGNAERNDWYGQSSKYESMRKAHEAMLRKQYNQS